MTLLPTAMGTQMKLAPSASRPRASGANSERPMSAISSGMPVSSTRPAIPSPRPGVCSQAAAGSAWFEHHSFSRGEPSSPSDSSITEQVAASVTEAALSANSRRRVRRSSSAPTNTARSCRRARALRLIGCFSIRCGSCGIRRGPAHPTVR